MKRSMLVIAALVLLLSGCITTGLPVKESNDDTVLIIASEVKETVKGKEGRAPFLEFKIDFKGPKGKVIQFLPTDGNIEIVTGLPAGEYMMGTIMTMKPNKLDTDPRYKADADESFEIKAGEITILPYVIQAVLEDRDPKEFDPEDNEPFYTKADYREITKEDKEEIMKKLASDPNFSSWKSADSGKTDEESSMEDSTNDTDDEAMPVDDSDNETANDDENLEDDTEDNEDSEME